MKSMTNVATGLFLALFAGIAQATTQPGAEPLHGSRMMDDGMMMGGGMMFACLLFGALLLIALVLAIFALIKYLRSKP